MQENYALHIEAYGNNGNHYIYHTNTCEWARIATTVQFKFEIVRKKSLLSAAVRYEFVLYNMPSKLFKNKNKVGQLYLHVPSITIH